MSTVNPDGRTILMGFTSDIGANSTVWNALA
jgi:hypothetical protein